MPREPLGAEPAAHLERAEHAVPRALEGDLRDVRGDEIKRLEGARPALREGHRDRIGLLPGRAGGGPHAQRDRALARQEPRDHDLREGAPEGRVAKEEGLVGRHRVDERAREGLAGPLGARRVDERTHAHEAVLFRHRSEAGIEQVALLVAHHDAARPHHEALHERPAIGGFRHARHRAARRRPPRRRRSACRRAARARSAPPPSGRSRTRRRGAARSACRGSSARSPRAA